MAPFDDARSRCKRIVEGLQVGDWVEDEWMMRTVMPHHPDWGQLTRCKRLGLRVSSGRFGTKQLDPWDRETMTRLALEPIGYVRACQVMTGRKTKKRRVVEDMFSEYV